MKYGERRMKKKHWMTRILTGISAIVLAAGLFLGMRNMNSGITAKELKEEYKYKDNNMVPVYNLPQEQKLIFDFAMDYSHIDNMDIRYTEMVSVHSDPSCSEESEIICYCWEEEHEGKIRLIVAPTEPVLATLSMEEIVDAAQQEDTEDFSWQERKTFWGQAPIYYICIHYDMDTSSVKKLNEPQIIPFTTVSDVEIPKVAGKIDDQGNFKLSWEAVPGAEYYRIYQYITGDNFSGFINEDTNGAANGYDNGTLFQIADTTDTEFTNFGEEEETDFPWMQNFGVGGTYFVTAVCNGKESNLSEAVDTYDWKLPRLISFESEIDGFYESTWDLPRVVYVDNIDGSVSRRPVSYQKKSMDDDSVEYIYKIKGTSIEGQAIVSAKEKMQYPETIEGSINTGMAETYAQLSKVPSMSGKSVLNNKGSQDTGVSFYEQAKKVTDSMIKSGNKESVRIANRDYNIFADSAEEAWISYHLMEGKNTISLKAFPRLQNPYLLEDTLLKVCNQNPYIMDVYSYDYDYNKTQLKVSYSDSKRAIYQKQQKIYQAGKEIVQNIILPSMTEDEKEEAIYQWLVTNCVYDEMAYKKMEKSQFQKIKGEKDNGDNAYGILLEKKGTCGGYAKAFQLLAGLSGLETKVVTGYLNGNIPHAWNFIRLKGSWYQIDCSNNENTVSIPYFMYNASEEQAEMIGYTIKKDALLDEEYVSLSKQNQEKQKEYYLEKGFVAVNEEDAEKIIGFAMENSAKKIVYRYEAEMFSEKELVNMVRRLYMQAGRDGELKDLSYLYSNGYVVIEP